MTTSAISNQYKSVEDTYNVDYALSKSSSITNKNVFSDASAAYDLENALATYNDNSSSLNLAKDSLTSNTGLFNSAQISYSNATSALERANQKLELLFDCQTQNTAALMSDSNTVGKEYAASIVAASGTAMAMGDGAIAPAETDIVDQDLSIEQIKEIVNIQNEAELKQQYEQLQNQQKLAMAQQEAERAKETAEDENRKLENAEAAMSNDKSMISNRQALLQSSEKEINNKKSILINKGIEDSSKGGSVLDLEV